MGRALHAHHLAALAESGRRAVATDPSAGAQLLEEALALWTGEPYADVADVDAVVPLVVHLHELRLSATEDLAAARLAMGQGPELVPQLGALAAAHPVRERTHALLARALYQAGRQAEALAALRSLADHLADELGLDPSPDVRELEAAVLRQDPALLPRSESRVAPESPGSPLAPPTAGAPPDDGFVGRTAELAELAAAWERTAAGRGSVVVVTGEPGMGKTRLVEAFVDRSGAAARWGRCPETPGAPPYWPWQQVLGGLPAATGSDDPGARFALAMDVIARLRQLAAQHPLLVVLDDLQWADADSLHVLAAVLPELRGSRLLFVITCRDDTGVDPALTAVLARAARVEGARRLGLHGLTSGEVAELVHRIAGAGDSALVEAVAARSGGNPFFVTELAAHGTEGRAVPAGVRDVLRARLGDLPADAHGVLAAVAVAGREVALAHVAAAMGRPVGDLRAGVDRGLRDGLLVEPVPGRLGVAHDLVREVVVADLGPTRRAELHAGLADALESGAAAATSAAAVAVHRSEAAVGGTDAAAASACLRAAREALDRAGDEEAAALAHRGLVHADPAPTDEIRADLLHVVGVAERRLGRLEQGAAALSAEARIGRARGDRLRVARAALASAGGGVGGFWAIYAAVGAGDTALVEEAAASAADLPPPVRSSVLAALAVQRAASGLDAAALADRAAVEAGDAAARARAAVAQYVTRWSPGHAGERLALARRMLAESAGHPAYEATALHLLRVSLVETLQPDEAAAVDRRYRDLARRRGDGDLLLLDVWWRSAMALARGDYDEARRLADEAVERTPAMSPAAMDLSRTSHTTVPGIIAWHEGRLPELVPAMVDLSTIQPQYLAVVAQGHAQAGRRDEALAAVDLLLARPGDGVFAAVHAVLLADVYVTLGDAERAAGMLPALEAWGDTLVVFWPGTTVVGPSALWRGQVLALLGRTDEARRDLLRALEVSEAFGLRPFTERARAALKAPG